MTTAAEYWKATDTPLPEVLSSILADWRKRAQWYADVSAAARTTGDHTAAAIWDSMQALTHDHIVRLAGALAATGTERRQDQ